MTDRGRVAPGLFPPAVAAVAVVAVAARTLPMYRSPLPFNPDGIVYAGLVAEALADGRLPLARMATDELHFGTFVAVASAVTGVDPMRLGQPVVALVGVGPVVLGVAVARRLGRHRGWPASRARFAAVLAGVLLAVEGLYLHRAMATDEQTLGLFLVPLGVVAAHRAYRTDRRAWWVATVAVLAALPPLHNLDAMIAALALTALLAVLAVRHSLDRGYAKLAALAAGFWLAFAGYHLLAERYTPASIIQQARIADAPGLLVAWVVAVALAGAWFVALRPRHQRALGSVAFAALFGLVGLNATTAVFPGTRATTRELLLLLLPLAVPVWFAVRDAPAVTRLGDGPSLFALGGGVFALVGLALTAALTPEYLGTALRSSTFLHLPVLVAASVGTAAVLAGRTARTGPVVRVGVAGLVVASAAASLPVAFGGLSMLTYKGVTTPAEMGATEFAVDHATVDAPPGAGASGAGGSAARASAAGASWAADDHLARIAPGVRLGAGGARAPVHQWLVGGGGPPDCLVLVQRSWTTTGAQLFPAAPARMSPDAYRSWRATSNVVYAGGGVDPIHAGVPPDGDAEPC